LYKFSISHLQAVITEDEYEEEDEYEYGIMQCSSLSSSSSSSSVFETHWLSPLFRYSSCSIQR
jgi:hypothetical protein